MGTNVQSTNRRETIKYQPAHDHNGAVGRGFRWQSFVTRPHYVGTPSLADKFWFGAPEDTGPRSLTLTTSGALVFGGTGFVITSAAPGSEPNSFVATASGQLVFGGSGISSAAFRYNNSLLTTSGQLVFGGDGISSVSLRYANSVFAASGQLVFGGSGISSAQNPTASQLVTPTGALIFGGEATVIGSLQITQPASVAETPSFRVPTAGGGYTPVYVKRRPKRTTTVRVEKPETAPPPAPPEVRVRARAEVIFTTASNVLTAFSASSIREYGRRVKRTHTTYSAFVCPLLIATNTVVDYEQVRAEDDLLLEII